MRGAKKTREKKKREYWEKKKKTKKKEERKSRVLYVCVCVVVVALNRLGEKLQDFFQRGDERVHVLFGVVDVETGASAAENVQVSVQRLRAVVAGTYHDAVLLDGGGEVSRVPKPNPKPYPEPKPKPKSKPQLKAKPQLKLKLNEAEAKLDGQSKYLTKFSAPDPAHPAPDPAPHLAPNSAPDSEI